MKKYLLWLGLALLSAAAATLTSCTKLKPVALPFEKEILAFAAADKTNPPPQGAIVFVGSSSVRLWKTLARDFPDHNVINRGFGGSQMSDVVRYADRIILPHKPKVIVVRVGGNDIAAGKSPERVAADFQALVEKIYAALPDANIVFLSLNSAPSRWKNVEKEKKVNRLVQDYGAAGHHGIIFVDLMTPMLKPDGTLREELFRPDRLHCNAAGYQLWTTILRPVLNTLDPP